MTQKEETKEEFLKRVENLMKETKALQTVKSANMLIELFGFDERFEKVKPKRLGKQIEMQFLSIGQSITFTLVNKREEFNCMFGVPKDPLSTIIINVDKEKLLDTLSGILVLKDNIMGLVKLLPKLITRKIKIKGSLFAAIVLCRCMMMGKHAMYKGQL